jgi:prephenate dehydrogenase
VAIAGLGLIGGSLAGALTEAGWHVIGVDRAAVGRRARARGLVVATRSTLLHAAREADLIVLAAPPRANRELLLQLAAVMHRRRELVVTDVGSVKRDIVQLAERLRLTGFVGGHPLAGRERSGQSFAQADLFAGRAWAVVPGRESTPAALRRVRALVRAVRARPVQVTAEAHDRALAFLSHLPQLLAWALRDVARADPVTARWLDLAGPGFRDMTRLAASPAPLWAEILKANADHVAEAQGAFIRALLARPHRRGK